MTEDIYIISGNKCEVNVDVEGDYILSCVAISGRLAITTVDAATDFIKYLYVSPTTGQTVERRISPAMTIRSTVSAALVEVITNGVCYKSATDGLYYYRYSIIDCSTNMKYLCGIKELPTQAGSTFQASPAVNGPPFFQVLCDKLTSCGLVAPNNFVVGNTFQLQGPSYVGDMANVTFSIKGLYDEDVAIDDDLLWQFQLTKLPPLIHGKNEKRDDQHKNADMRLEHQYGKRN